jgi:hypothetical protein
MNSESVTIQKKTVINGTITAEGYYSSSDLKLKKNVVDVDPLSDLEIIKKVCVKDFTWKSTNKSERGVIAQEIEELIPGIIKEEEEYIASICDYAIVAPNAILIFEMCHLSELTVGNKLKVHQKKDVFQYVQVLNLRVLDFKLHVSIDKQFDAYKVYVYGPFSKYKVIDKDQLFMILLNAFKATLS